MRSRILYKQKQPFTDVLQNNTAKNTVISPDFHINRTPLVTASV